MFKDSIRKWFIRDRKILAAALACGVLLSTVLAVKSFSEEMQSGIANEVIRFHVRANSDSYQDQQLKNLVKNEVLERFHEGLSSAKNIDETRTFLSENIEEIKAYAEAIINTQGYSYGVDVKLCRDFFPTRVYGDMSFPPGEYETLRIDIGDAAGQNWWCVMFPPLCFVDAAQTEIPEAEKQQFKNLLTEDKYDLLTKAEKEGEVSVQVKFKVVEIWQELKRPLWTAQNDRKQEESLKGAQ